MSGDNTNSAATSNTYKTPPIRIGTGLSRSKLITGGSPSKPLTRPISGTLTSPTRVNISSSGLTPVSRTHSERYQSAFSRLGVPRNTSSPSLNELDGVDNDANNNAGALKTTRDIDKKWSAKRASFPAATFTTSPLATADSASGQSSTKRYSAYLESKYSLPTKNGDNASAREPQTSNNVPSSSISDKQKQEAYTNTTASVPVSSKEDTNRQTSRTDIASTIETKTVVSQLERNNTGKDNINLNNYVIPPRRRHKAKDKTESPREQTSADISTNLESNKNIEHLGSDFTDSVSVTKVSQGTEATSVDACNDRLADIDEPPKPMVRTRRRLTKRAKSFKKLEDDEYIGFASLPEQVHRKAVRRGFEFTLMVVAATARDCPKILPFAKGLKKNIERYGEVGFASLPEQVHRKAVRRGFEFTLMVVGETGLGKSTLINSLFLTDLYKDRKVGKIEERVQKTVELEKKELEIEERGVKLKLTIVDTPGFNDAVNAEESWKPIVNYIDKQFESYFKAESGLNRKNIQDTRVHCCLYFISPYGHGLRPVDVLVMKKLHQKVNIVPLVAKADMLTKREIKALKEKVLQEVQKHKIHIYQFPDCDSDEDEEFKLQDQELKKAIPFAVVGSNTVVEAGGKKIRGRMYPWGIVEVENPSHCDFVKLRQMLISTHMQDLKDVTCDVHYENYRAEHISEQMTGQQKERGKLKRDSVTNMDKVMDTEKLLQEKEAEIKRMQEMLAKMQSQLNQNSPKMNGKVAAV